MYLHDSYEGTRSINVCFVCSEKQRQKIRVYISGPLSCESINWIRTTNDDWGMYLMIGNDCSIAYLGTLCVLQISIRWNEMYLYYLRFSCRSRKLPSYFETNDTKELADTI